jgi:hypothetical protein
MLLLNSLRNWVKGSDAGGNGASNSGLPWHVFGCPSLTETGPMPAKSHRLRSRSVSVGRCRLYS